MPKSYTVTLKREPEEVLEKAKDAATINKFKIEGTPSEGRFLGQGVEGSYAVEGNVLHLTVTKKPGLIPWGLIESKLKKFFS